MGRFVGVDVVDLSRHEGEERARDTRFLKRVFSEHERARIEAAADPELEIWKLWASKEAGFKVFSKSLPDLPVFHHARFAVTDPPGEEPRHLSFGEESVQVSVTSMDGVVLATALDDPSLAEVVLTQSFTVDAVLQEYSLSADWEGWVQERFSEEERDPIHSVASAAVRLVVRTLAAECLGVEEARLSVICPPGHTGLRPPFLHLDGHRVQGADISFSHDGSRLALAIRLGDAVVAGWG